MSPSAPVRAWYVVSFGSWNHGDHQPDPAFTLFASDLWPPLPMTLNHTGYSGRLARWRWGGAGAAQHCGNGTAAEGCATLIAAGGTSLLSLTSAPTSKIEPLAPALHVFAPECANGWTLLGELEKFSTVSAQRFSKTACTATGLEMTVTGTAGEKVEVTALSKMGKVEVKVVAIGAEGTATLVF